MKMRGIRRPRLCEVLGVGVGEKFTFMGDTYYVDRDGELVPECGGEWTEVDSVLCSIIRCPEAIRRQPRLTEPEVAICRMVGAEWVVKDDIDERINCVTLLKGKAPDFGDGMYACDSPGTEWLCDIRADLFPSVEPGDCIKAGDAGAGAIPICKEKA